MSNTALLGSYGAQDSSSLMFRNRIINGDMRIDQRNAGASVTPTDGQYGIDRWKAFVSQASKFSFQQNAGAVTPPSGFANYFGCTSLAATTVGAADYFLIQQSVEGFNIADLAWGTVAAQSVTISFWVRSSLTGTFGGALVNASNNRGYPFSYAISSANTWEYKTVTIAGDTTGTWGAGNGVGVQVRFSLGAGSNLSSAAGTWVAADRVSATGATSVVGTNGATFYITGVQLEAGPTATPFERRPYSVELALAQRYCERIDNSVGKVAASFCMGMATNTTNVAFIVPFAVPKRVVPLSSQFLASGSGTFQAADGNIGYLITSLTYSEAAASTTSANLGAATSGVTQYRPYYLQTVNGQTPYMIFSAEL